MMPTDHLAAIQMRLSQATPGQWQLNHLPNSQPHEFESIGTEDDPYAICTTDSNFYGPCWEDAQLIAHAPTDLAYLLARLKAAEAENQRLKDALEAAKKI